MINRSLNDYVHLRQAYVLREKELAVSDSLLNYYKDSVNDRDKIIDIQNEKFVKQELYYKELLHKESKKLQKKSIGVGVGGTLLGIVLGVLLCK